MKENHSRNPAAVSVIIPTHNRWASLKRTLEALSVQTYPLQKVEILVVADGCTDDTVKMLQRYRAPFSLKIIKQPGRGAAASRNQGATQASAPLLLFLDDDVEPTPCLIEAHIQAHWHQPGRVVIGAYPPVRQSSTNFFHNQLRAWWDDKFDALRQPGHRFTYQDLLSGNFSLEAPLFHRLRGFDETIKDCGGEDYEFGLRLIKARVTFSFVPAAMGYHHIQETTDLKRIFQRARQEGWVDVTMAQHHPEIKAGLLLAQLKHTRWRYRFILHLLIFIGSFISDKLMTQLQRVLYPLERVALRTYWKKLYGCLHLYWYWRGVADRLKTWQALVNFVREESPPLDYSESYLDLDLRQGLAAAEAQLDRERPASLWIHYGQQSVGFFPPQPGTERWRGEHLRPLLADKLASPFLEALALEGVIQGSAQLDRHKLYQSLKGKAPWFGPTRLEQMWYEQYSQWNQFERRASGNEEQLDQNWELIKKQEDEMIWLAQKLNEMGWRNRLYLTLYRWHQPFYEWYSHRGWNWLTFFRERIKQTLFSQDKA